MKTISDSRFCKGLAWMLCLCMLLALLPAAAPRVFAAGESYADGVYQGSGEGRNGEIVLSVTIAGGQIAGIEAISQNETPRFWEKAVALFPAIIAANSPEVDGVTGATYSSNGIKQAVRAALSQADETIPGSGTAEDPFVIQNAVQLLRFASMVDAGDAAFVSAFVELGADLDLSAVERFDPIGQEGKASSNTGMLFAGSFDGKGHTISNLTISGEYDAEANVGLFSTLADTARVRNLRLENVSVKVTETGSWANVRAGAVAGDTARTSGARAAIVDGCFVSGSVTVQAADGQGFAGGILGRAFTKSAIINCVADVRVDAVTVGGWNSAYAGGIAGMTGNGTVLANSAAFGDVSAANVSGSNDAYAGGLVGVLNSSTFNTYATGSVSITQMAGVDKQFVGALAGQQSGSPAGSYNYYSEQAALSVLDEDGNATTLEARPWSPDDLSGNASAEAKTTAQMHSAAFAELLNANAPAVVEALNEDTLALRGWALENGRVVVTDRPWNELPPKPTVFASGSGTEADPWMILTAEQLSAFSDSVNAGESYSGSFICLGADLDLSQTAWTPAGGSGTRFDGSFDGSGHVISGLNAGTPENPMELDGENAYLGLFGWLGEHAVIRDLQLEVHFHTHSAGSVYVGGLAGRISGSDVEGDYHGALIDGCTVTGEINHVTDKGTSFLGGVAGHVFKGAIINTWTNVRMTGAEKSGELVELGGIAGLLNRALVANCCTLGSLTGSGYRQTEYDIEGMACVGGIAGVNGGYITNCYSAGDVTALEYSIDTGVLAGWVTGIAKVYHCFYNEAAAMTIDGRAVDPVDPFGEVAGAGVSDEYGFPYPGGLVDSVSAYQPTAEDAARVAAELNAAFAAFPIDIVTVYGLPADCLRLWTAEADHAVLSDTFGTVNYVKPEIENNAQEPEPALRDGVWCGRSEDRSTVAAITVENGEITKTELLQGEAQGEAYDYALARAKFKSHYGDATDYAPADFSRFAGSGTEEDPYLIETEAQLRYLAEAINEDVDWYDLYFLQSADLDCSDADWRSIGWGIFADADNDGFGQDLVALYPFRGHYDGGNHRITGLRAGTEEAPLSGGWLGLFGVLQGEYSDNEIPSDSVCVPSVRNVHLEDVSFFSQNNWRDYVGGLVGNAQGGFVIDNCSVTGEIHSRSTEDFSVAGGLAGSLMYGAVTDCWTDVDVWAWSGKNYSYAAGMAGVTNRATVVNSFTLGNTHGAADQTNRAEVGGFVALDGGVCVNCYAKGAVEVLNKYSMYLGGFVGMAASSSEQRQCYFNVDADQIVAGKPVAEKRYAGKQVNDSVDADSQARTAVFMASDGFRVLLEGNRSGIATTLAEVRTVLGADETGSSAYHSIYYNGDGSDLNRWIVRKDHVGFADLGKRFEDVREESYYFDPVCWAVANGITAGTDETHFSPDAACTREQVVTFLWAAADRPAPETTENPFTDVKAKDWFYSAVLWASENEVTGGVGHGSFGVGQSCTREQVVTFLYAAAGRPAPETTENPFTDVKAKDWFYSAVLWASENEVTGGVGHGSFGVGQSCTRAQIVTFLYAYIAK